MALTQIDDRGLKTPIDLLDNEKIRLGTGNDLQFYHDGTDNYISTSNGHLNIYGDGSNEIYIRGLYNEDSIIIVPNGTVKLFHDNSQKLETTSWGTQIYGALATTGNIDCATDSYKIKAGAGGDLEIYHNGTNSYVKNSTNALVISGNDLNFENAALNETYAEMNNGGAVTLWYDNTKTFETTSAGATITRDLTLNHASGDTALRWAVGGTNKFSLYESSGTLRFYDNTNSAERMRIDSAGRLYINQTTNIVGTAKLEVMGTSDTTYPQYSAAIGIADTREYNTANGAGNGIGFAYKYNNGGSYAFGPNIRGFKENTVDGNYAGALAFYTRPNGGAGAERLRIDSHGHMGLGVTPNQNWPSNGDFRAFQLGTGACIFGRGSGDEDRGGIAVNYYADGSGNKYLANGLASRIYLNDGNIDLDNTEVANTSGAGAGLTLKTRMRIDKDGVISTKSRGANTPVTYEFNYNDGAGGAAQTVNLATIANYNDVTSAVAEVTWVGVYATAQNLIATGKWICGVRRANNNAAWAQTAEEVALSGNGSSASIDVSWDSGVLKAVTVGAWVGWTVNVRITVLNAGLTVNV